MGSKKQKTTALAVAKKPDSIQKLSVKALGEGFNDLLKKLADYMSQPLSVAQKVNLYGLTKRMEDEVEAAVKQSRQWAMELVLTKGEQTTDKGTKRLVINGLMVEAQPMKTGYDDKKVQAMLLSKNMALESGMNQVVSYTVNDDKLAMLITKQLITEDELENCRADMSYRLMRPKPVAEEE